MKNLAYFLIIIFCTLPVMSQDFTREEVAVKKVIEDETEYFRQRNYEQWQSCWDSSWFIRTTASPNGFGVIHDWKKYAENMQESMKKNPDPLSWRGKKDNYSFQIADDFALVTLTEHDNLSIRGLRKVDGEWKLFYISDIISKQYRTLEQTSALQHFTGHWRLDPASFKVNPAWETTKMNNYEFDFYCDDAGSHMQGEWNYTNQNGNTSTNFNYLLAHDTDKNLSKIMGTHYRSGWTQLLTGEFSIDESSDLTLELYRIGNDQLHSKSEYSFSSGESIHVREEYFGPDGNITQTINYDLIKD